MKDKTIYVLVVVAIMAALVSVGIGLYALYPLLDTQITGKATAGEVNVTIESVLSINFTTGSVRWSSGRVNDGVTSAALTTFATGNVTGGNWTLQTAGGLRIENIGNVNVTLNLSATKAASAFIGGTSPIYKWNITSVETNSCHNTTGTGEGSLNLNAFYDVNTSTTTFCNKFNFLTDRDVVRIDFNLTIPSDSFTGTLSDVITAVVTTAS